ncbi:MAG: 1,4-dihydroxy-2-naphthoate prenyltransferase [marine actinobacterium MedAcidi-G3]|nr:MAG: 1,4-dihydroxy-2-naphthoate prenyltransferase [marine actinobacterium MedAcidi-G3]OUW86702.1 MAG: 1,4-dihydroxy-2-naphthoate polyprenyltransferase [Acidimicrobiaceae bacterium TMED224]
MTSLSIWFSGARPRTWPAAVVPVLVGTAAVQDKPDLLRALLALVVGLALQIAVNYANDYSDGVRGTDDQRVGPQRLVASGVVPPRSVKRAAFCFFGVAASAGLYLSSVTSWWLLLVGAAAITAAWCYTGGPKPYGYSGLGELFVFVFFGLVASIGTTYIQDEEVTPLAVGASVPVGLLAVALLVTNNLRDLPGDGLAGKRTLAVRIGDKPTRILYVLTILMAFLSLPYLSLLRPGALLALLALPAAIAPVRSVLRGTSGVGLVAVLGATGKLQMIYGTLLCVGLALGI